MFSLFRPKQQIYPSGSLSSEAWRRLRKNKLAMISIVFLTILSLLCFLAPLLPIRAWDAIEFVEEPIPPSAAYWFGTDGLGRDLFSRVLYGGRVSLSVGIIASSMAVTIGVLYGATSGFFAGKIDRWMMRFVDFMYSIPSYFVIIMIQVVFQVHNILFLFAMLSLFQWLGSARVVRSQILSLRERDFVTALHASGISSAGVILRHMIPNVLGIVAVYATLTVPGIMLQEAFLSFIGIGFQARGSDGVMKDIPSWGSLLGQGVATFETTPWLLIFPAVLFSMTLLAISFLGDGLRDALDPNLRK